MKAAAGPRHHHARPRGGRGHPSPWTWIGLGQTFACVLLAILATILLTGLALVDSTRQHRQMSRELQELREQVYSQEEERGRLLLEISTFALADRIERVAREELRMRMPAPEDIVVVRND